MDSAVLLCYKTIMKLSTTVTGHDTGTPELEASFNFNIASQMPFPNIKRLDFLNHLHSADSDIDEDMESSQGMPE